MTWGKLLVHWDHSDGLGDNNPTSNLLHVMCYLNDRFALDGLSPPSYTGLLWCIGWSDKPDRKGGISVKRRYKLSASKFQDAEHNLMNDKVVSSSQQTNILSSFNRTTSKRSNAALNEDQHDIISMKKVKRSDTKTLHHFFHLLK